MRKRVRYVNLRRRKTNRPMFQALDVSVFYLINHGLAWGPLDAVMPVVTHKFFGWAVFGAVGVYLTARFRTDGLVCFVVAVAAVLLADAFGHRILKPLIGRERPCVELGDARILVAMSTSYAMPSLHAANSFAFATAVYRYFPSAGAYLFPVAAVIAFSRVYIGVHWPSDVLVGALYGVLCALLVTSAEDRISRYIAERRGEDYVTRRRRPNERRPRRK